MTAVLGASCYNSFGNGWWLLREQITTDQLSYSNFLGVNVSLGQRTVIGLSLAHERRRWALTRFPFIIWRLKSAHRQLISSVSRQSSATLHLCLQALGTWHLVAACLYAYWKQRQRSLIPHVEVFSPCALRPIIALWGTFVEDRRKPKASSNLGVTPLHHIGAHPFMPQSLLLFLGESYFMQTLKKQRSTELKCAGHNQCHQ